MTDDRAREDGAESDEEFEELRLFLESQRVRHRRLVGALLGGSIAIALVAVALLATGRGGIAGWFLLGAAGLGLVRGLLSAFTDMDTRDRGEFEAMQADLDRDVAAKLGEEP